jgi:Holliday junction DNA helicase RuvA
MIAFLRGELAAKGEDFAVIDVGGVGYEAQVTTSDASALPGIGDPVMIYTYLYVREDVIGLYGFLRRDDLTVFKQLLTVSGVGPRGALGILSALSASQLRMAILAEDVKSITRAPGIGARTVKRLIIELKDKMNLEDVLETGEGEQVQAAADPAAGKEVVLAIGSLGYSRSDALRAVKSVSGADAMEEEELLRQALKEIIRF